VRRQRSSSLKPKFGEFLDECRRGWSSGNFCKWQAIRRNHFALSAAQLFFSCGPAGLFEAAS